MMSIELAIPEHTDVYLARLVTAINVNGISYSYQTVYLVMSMITRSVASTCGMCRNNR